MALWGNYSISNDDIHLVATVRWKLTSGGAVIHTDTWRYDLTDRALGTPAMLAARIVREIKQRARTIDAGVAVYAGVQSELTVPENTDVLVIP